MRVLWICNMMFPAVAEQLHMEAHNKEGWVSGLADIVLENQAENGIELAVAFPAMTDDTLFNEPRQGIPLKIVMPGEVTRGEVHTGRGHLVWYGFAEDVQHAHLDSAGIEARVKGIIEDFRPDLVHCFGTEFGHTLAALQCGYDKNRILVGIQGVCARIAECYMAGLPEKVQRSVTFRDLIKRDSLRRQQEKYALRGKREQKILKLAANVTGRTAFDREYVLGVNPGLRYFAMNENLRSCFYEGRWSRENCVPHRIFVSQADYPLKGFHYLLLAMPELLKRYPDLEVHVAGDNLTKFGTLKEKLKISAYGKYLRELINGQGLQGRVTFLGRISAEEMKAEALGCGLFLCCSANENSPNSLGEAMLLGVPCAATDTGGIPSIFDNGRDGLLYTLGTEELVKTVCEMWDNFAITDVFCENARKHAEMTHNKEANYRKMVEIYSNIAGEGQE